MKTPNTNPSPRPDDMPGMDAEYLSLMVDLDRLAAADRAAPTNLEDRLMQATLPALHGVQPVVTQMAELGSIDRASAPSDLEDGVFEASAPALRGSQPALVLRHSAEDARLLSTHARRPIWANQFARLAAAVVLVSGVAIGVRMDLVSPTPTIHAEPSIDVASGVKRDMETLFAVIDTKPATTTTTEPASDTDTEDLTTWLIEGTPS